MEDEEDFDDKENNPYEIVYQQIQQAKQDLIGLNPTSSTITAVDDDDLDEDWDDD